MAGRERDRLVAELGAFRRELIPDFVLELLRGLGDELSLIHIATLYVLDGTDPPPSLRELADRIDRSVSATSRLTDHLVRRAMVDRREDTEDRRTKRFALAPAGEAFLRKLERSRAEAQLQIMNYLTAEERDLVTRAMTLLGEASRRRSHDRRSDRTEESR